MITPVTEIVINEQSGVLESFDAHIKGENLWIVLDFLRNRCYSDIPSAVLREYATNAQDIHNRHGITKPIQISLPCVLDSFLKIRDFGPALENSKLGDLFMSYGESDKRGSNAETGALGLGCKCGFAYGDSFLVNAYRQGVLSIWNAYIDPSKKGKFDRLHETPTTEPDGIEIVIPIKDCDIPLFRSKAMKVYGYFGITPEFTNIQPDELAALDAIKNPKVTFTGKGWRYINRQGSSIAVMANVAYTLSMRSFTDTEIPPDLKKLVDGGIIIDFANGDLEFAISREELQYTPVTKQNIIKRLKEIADEITTQAEAKFNGCLTLWDAKLLWQDVFRMDGGMFAVRDLFNRKVKFKGQSLNNAAFELGSKFLDVEASMYLKGHRKIERQTAYKIEVAKTTLVLVNDTDIANGILNRVIKPLYDGTHTPIYILKFKTLTAEADWRKETGFDAPLKSLKDMPKVAMSDYYGKTDNAGYFSPKHTSREFTYDLNSSQCSKPSYRRNNSDYWVKADVDLNTDAGVYVELQKFEYMGPNGCYTRSLTLQEVIDQLTACGIAVPTIYGFKPSSAAKAKANVNMVTFWDWMKKEIQQYWTNNPTLIQDWANRYYFKNSLSTMQRELPELGKIIRKWSSLPANSALLSFFDKVNQIAKYNDHSLVQAERLLNYVSYRPTGLPVHDVIPELKKLTERYPLLFNSALCIGVHRIATKEWNKPCEDYVQMVDTLNP
jgi:hypothetical protein